MRSLHATKHGANPLLHLSLVCPTRYDPEFYALWNTIKMFRKHCNPDIAFPLLTAIVNSGLRQYYQGPWGALLNCLTSVAWTWEDNHTIVDHEGLCIHILHTPIQIIKTRLIWAWQLAVGSKLCTRDEFNGIQYVDRELTMHKHSKFPPDSQGLLRVVFNGTFYTRDKLYHNGYHPTRNCPYWGLLDGVYHRHWECDKFVDLCTTIPMKVRSFLDGMPDSMVLHGWCPRPSGARRFSQLLDTLPDLTGQFVAGKSEMEILHLFTDGTCEEPQLPTVRLAAWGVAIADMSTGGFLPISQGPVWGQHQTILRAEITGAISAFRYGLFSGRRFMVWTDNKQVFEGIHRFSGGDGPPDLMSTDHDLWEILHGLVYKAVGTKIFDGVVKVRSHQDSSAYPFVEQWAIEGNDFADSLAQTAIRGLPAELLQVWEQMRFSRQQIAEARDWVHKLFVDVGHRAIRLGQSFE